MKIAFLFGSLNRGGTETLMLDVCKNLDTQAFQAIGVYRKPGVLEDAFRKSGVPFYYLPASKNILAYLLRLRKLLLSKKVQLVHAQQPIDALFAYMACMGTSIKVVLTLHGFDFQDSTSLLKFILKRTDLNIYVSQYQQQYYIKKYKLQSKKQAVVFNGMDFNKLQAQSSASGTLRKELNISEDTLLMAMVGNFNEVRDQLTVCKFLHELHQSYRQFHFVFIGRRVDAVAHRYDDCVDFCRKHGLEQHVSFLGLRNDVPALLPEMNAFVYSTEHDTFGIAVLEAMAANIPVFVNDWAVMQEITGQGKYATLYKTKDEKDLLRQFLLFLQDRDQYLEKAQWAVDYVHQRFSILHHIEQLRENYHRTLNIQEK
ncbi:MAG TPA: glycosyltransferase family 4 protein [Paludibacter sp.]|nr:glycosyltransferase family 4 protein [Paludibacter sp.]HPM09597.1 glycosyltransferase family 4 protein [Paludibacter sp.]